MKPIVLFDVDGVIADFARQFIDVCNKINNTNIKSRKDKGCWDLETSLGLTQKQIDLTWKELEQPGYILSIKPFPKAVEFIKKIDKIAKVYFVTSPMKTHHTFGWERRQWLINHFGIDLGNRLIVTEHKYLVQGDFLIDDKPSNVIDWKNYGCNYLNCDPIIWGHFELDKHLDIERLNDWNELYKRIKNFK